MTHILSLTTWDGGTTLILLMEATQGRAIHKVEVVTTLMGKEEVKAFMNAHKKLMHIKEEPVLRKLMEEPLKLLVLP